MPPIPLLRGRVLAAVPALLLPSPRAPGALSAPRIPTAQMQAGHRVPRVVFATEFSGVDSAGHCVWTGRVTGDVVGNGTLALQQVEDPIEAANPVWHVRAHWSVTAQRPSRSFAADLEGMVDWKTGANRLSGVITVGWMHGAWVRQEGRFVRGDVTGTLEIIPSLASR